MIAALAPFLPFYVVGILIGGQAAEKLREGETESGHAERMTNRDYPGP
jgi:hypothetical protein